MKIRNIKCVVLVCLSLISLGCTKNDAGTYIYKPFKNITFTLHTKELKYRSDVKAVFLHFDLQIENNSNKEVLLNIGKIQANLNGVNSRETYYDSLASVMPEKEILNRGLTEHKLYFVFPESIKNMNLRDFRVTSHGLSIN